jgi:hypothetical protein
MLNKQAFIHFIQNAPEIQQHGGLVCDIFADNWSAQLPDFWSMHWTVGSLKVNAWAHGWSPEAIGKRGLLYINPPWTDMLQVLNKIRQDKANAVVIYPTWNATWQALWHHLPVVKVITLPRWHNLLQAGPRTKHPGYIKAHYRVKAAVIVWATT